MPPPSFMSLSEHAQYRGGGIKLVNTKWGAAAIINGVHATCGLPAVTCQKKVYIQCYILVYNRSRAAKLYSSSHLIG